MPNSKYISCKNMGPEIISSESEALVETPLSLAIIIPYRDRHEHLMAFVPYMESFIKGIKFNIVLVEQADKKPFNRGKLLNIGFSLSRSGWFCFHDIDMLPETGHAIIHFRNSRHTWQDARDSSATACRTLSIWAAY
jgi:hypothetical protein